MTKTYQMTYVFPADQSLRDFSWPEMQPEIGNVLSAGEEQAERAWVSRPEKTPLPVLGRSDRWTRESQRPTARRDDEVCCLVPPTWCQPGPGRSPGTDINALLPSEMFHKKCSPRKLLKSRCSRVEAEMAPELYDIQSDIVIILGQFCFLCKIHSATKCKNCWNKSVNISF